MSCDYIDPDLRRLFDFQHGLATNKQLRLSAIHRGASNIWSNRVNGQPSSTAFNPAPTGRSTEQ